MTTYDNRDRGVLFNNQDRKEKPTDADYGGTLNVDGKEFWLNGWIKESKTGKKFMSLSVKPKNAEAAKQPKQSNDFDDSIPF
jgi:hypothetical protein